jgi:hypothetical protein
MMEEGRIELAFCLFFCDDGTRAPCKEMGCFGGSQRWGATSDRYTLFIGIMGDGRRSLPDHILVGGGVWGSFWWFLACHHGFIERSVMGCDG